MTSNSYLNNSFLIGIILIACSFVTQIKTEETELAQSDDIITSFDEIRLQSIKDENFNFPQDILQKIESIFGDISESSNQINLLKARSQGKNETDTYFEEEEPNSLRIHKYATIALKATQKLLSYGESTGTYDRYKGLKLIHNLRIPEDFCPNAHLHCCDPYYQYRLINGSCNNLKNPWWGMTDSPFKRLLPAEYGDKINFPRVKSYINGKTLPNTRVVATVLHQPKRTFSDYSQMFIFFGQSVSHDTSVVSKILNPDGTEKICDCAATDEDCFNIPLPPNDPFIKTGTCLPFTRSSASVRSFDCFFGAREQLVVTTHYLDLSPIYGATEAQSLLLRGPDGKLLVSESPVSKFGNMPFSDPNGVCDLTPPTTCYLTGDRKLDNHSLLAASHTIWLRNHNSLADELMMLNPQWNEEKIFQEARRINIAQYQYVIYNEWLPILIGNFISKSYYLLPLKDGYLYRYNDDLYPVTSNEFSTAAFRLHNLVNAFSGKADPNLLGYDYSDINTFNFNITKYHDDSEGIMRGFLVNTMYYSTPQMSDPLNNRLFEALGRISSMGAINNQRGRDHGIPPYYKYRELCGLGKVKSFDDLTNIPKFIVDRLRYLYASVYDIDLYAGGVSELPVKDGVIGPTFACIIAKQFYDLKFGDRFHFEHGEDRNIRFTLNQLAEIRKTTMSKIFCKNVETNYVTKYSFLKPHPKYNPIINCANQPDISLQPWLVNTTQIRELEAYFASVPF